MGRLSDALLVFRASRIKAKKYANDSVEKYFYKFNILSKTFIMLLLSN